MSVNATVVYYLFADKGSIDKKTRTGLGRKFSDNFLAEQQLIYWATYGFSPLRLKNAVFDKG